jgi:Membrane carboxypeptidase/penicillin-binding protein
MSSTSAAAAGPGHVIGGHAAAEMIDMMQSVILSGTGKAAALDRPAAGKTGTSQDLPRCLVHRLHRRSRDRRLGRQ